MSTTPILPNILIRFGMPTYNPSTKKMKFPVELYSDTPGLTPFGINMRFFYDSTFQPGTKYNGKVVFKDYAPGYGLQAQASIGTGTAGVKMFSLPSPEVTYVNWAVQLFSAQAKPLIISSDPFNWTKWFAVELETKSVLSGVVCPTLILEKKPNPAQGGFFAGSGGVIISTLNRYESGEFYTTPTVVYAEPFNWEAVIGATVMPWGYPDKVNCFSL